MKTFAVCFRFKTRPLFRKGKWKVESKIILAADQLEALRTAKEYAEAHYRGRWFIESCGENSGQP